MPFPDTLPAEIWRNIASASIAQTEGARPSVLIPWLQVAPYTSAKWMHDAAFERVFRDLQFSIKTDEKCLEAALLLSRYTREEQLRQAVRSVTCHWNADFMSDASERLDTDDPEYQKRKRTLRMIKELVCEVLQQLPVIRELHWSNVKLIWPLPLSRKIYSCLSQHFHTLTILKLSGCEFDDPLDLSSAVSLSTLHLDRVRLVSTSFAPCIILDAKLHSLSLHDVRARDESHRDYEEDSDENPDPPPSPLIDFLDLSEISHLTIERNVFLTSSDLEHMFPSTSMPRAVGERLHTLRLAQVGGDMVNALWQCRAFPSLCELCIDFEPYHVLDQSNADRTISQVSSFVGKQKALEDLGISLADMYALHPDDVEEEKSISYDEAIAKPYLREACAGLKHLHRLSLGTFDFGSLYPLLHEQFVLALPALKIFMLECVVSIDLSEDVLDDISRTVNRYPNLTSFGYALRGATSDDDYETEQEDKAELAEAFSASLIRHAPRIEFFYIHNKIFRLTDRIQEMSLSDPQSLARYKEIYPR